MVGLSTNSARSSVIISQHGNSNWSTCKPLNKIKAVRREHHYIILSTVLCHYTIKMSTQNYIRLRQPIPVTVKLVNHFNQANSTGQRILTNFKNFVKLVIFLANFKTVRHKCSIFDMQHANHTTGSETNQHRIIAAQHH